MNDATRSEVLDKLNLNDSKLDELAIDQLKLDGNIDVYPQEAIYEYMGWRQFVTKADAVRPAMPTESEFGRMTKAEKNAFKRSRILYHSQFGPLVTPALQRVHNETIRLASLNYRAAPGARMGVVLDGLGTVGKSTIVMNVGKKYEQQLRKLLKRPADLPNGHAFIPVAYISLPSSVTIKKFNARVVSYYNIPVRKRESDDELTEKILKTAAKCATSMFIIDDVHFLNVRSKHGTSVNDHLKYLASHISATFLYAGIDLKGRHFISEGTSQEKAHRSQTQHRFRRYAIEPYEKRSDEYASLITSFGEHLLLLRQQPGSLYDELGDYIHDRTAGYIGAISNLLRQGGNLAIEEREERLSAKLLNTIYLDDAAEEYSKRVLGAFRKRAK